MTYLWRQIQGWFHALYQVLLSFYSFSAGLSLFFPIRTQNGLKPRRHSSHRSELRSTSWTTDDRNLFQWLNSPMKIFPYITCIRIPFFGIHWHYWSSAKCPCMFWNFLSALLRVYSSEYVSKLFKMFFILAYFKSLSQVVFI